MILDKEDASTSDEQVEVLYIEYNLTYRACVVKLIYLFSTRVDLYFELHKLETFSSNPGKLHFEGLVHFMGYIRDNNSLGLKYYANIEDETLSDLLIQAGIKSEKQLMVLSD